MDYVIVAIIFLIVGACIGVLVASLMITAGGGHEKEL